MRKINEPYQNLKSSLEDDPPAQKKLEPVWMNSSDMGKMLEKKKSEGSD